MQKPIEIVEIKLFYIICKFSDSSLCKLLIEPLFAENPNRDSAKKVLNQKNFLDAQIGKFGQLYWNNAAKITDYNG